MPYVVEPWFRPIMYFFKNSIFVNFAVTGLLLEEKVKGKTSCSSFTLKPQYHYVKLTIMDFKVVLFSYLGRS